MHTSCLGIHRIAPSTSQQSLNIFETQTLFPIFNVRFVFLSIFFVNSVSKEKVLSLMIFKSFRAAPFLLFYCLQNYSSTLSVWPVNPLVRTFFVFQKTEDFPIGSPVPE